MGSTIRDAFLIRGIRVIRSYFPLFVHDAFPDQLRSTEELGKVERVKEIEPSPLAGSRSHDRKPLFRPA